MRFLNVLLLFIRRWAINDGSLTVDGSVYAVSCIVFLRAPNLAGNSHETIRGLSHSGQISRHFHHAYPCIRSSRWSPTRRALAMIVRAGFTAALDGKKLPSTM